jgi:hypothetical protein
VEIRGLILSYDRFYETVELTDYPTKDKKTRKYYTKHKKVTIDRYGRIRKKRIKIIRKRYLN